MDAAAAAVAGNALAVGGNTGIEVTGVRALLQSEVTGVRALLQFNLLTSCTCVLDRRSADLLRQTEEHDTELRFAA